ncbi:MAG: ABC transporter ATP-binding protein [Thermoprotei archaeon]
MSDVVLRVENITKRFGELIAVNNVSFEVKRGEIFSLLGPSGCGKTTTLRIISGLEIPDSGRVYIEDEDVTFKPPRERRVCLVFQEYAVFPHMSVYDNIAFGLRARKLSREEINKKVREVAELLDLQESLSVKAGKLGLSEQQRIAIARCLVVEPLILLLDEPLTLVDAKVKERMRRELRRLQKELKITMIYVTHDQLEALMLSDRVAVMNKGRILQIGSPQEIYDKPANLFVATFVGTPTINLVEGVLKVEADTLKLISDNEELVLVKNFSGTTLYNESNKLSGKTVVVGVRPEDITISPQGYLKGRIVQTEAVGDRLALHVEIAKNITLRVLTDLYTRAQLGEIVSLEVKPHNIHIFDKETGNRLL